MKKRIISFLLVMALLLSMAPMVTIEAEASTVTQNAAQSRSLSTGVQNIVKRAKQMTQIKWTPQKDIIGWGGGLTYKAGVTYTGLPYGQPVNTSYVPWSTSLEGFITAVNDSGSKMYTSYSSYNKRAPYYSIDCSAFVSWAWGLSSRQTTSTIKNFATQISASAYANAQVGDCLCKAGDHVVLITDITYDGNGNIDSIEISESTVNAATNYCCQVTRYGKNGTKTLSQLQSKYLDSGYILYRSKTRDNVTYTHSCVVPLESDSCTNCDGYTPGGTPATCACSASYAGNYICITTSKNLNIRSGHGTSYAVLGSVPKGATVYVSKASGSGADHWAHVEYNGISGYASMEYLTKQSQNPTPTPSETEEWKNWAQTDSRWGSLRLGSSSCTVASHGCLVTSVAKLMIQAGLKNPANFDVGTLVKWLNSNGGFTSGGSLYWGKPATYSGFANHGYLMDSGSYSASSNNDKLINWIKQGYHMTIAVKSEGHWVAIDEAKSLETGEIYIMDTLSSGKNVNVRLVDRYPTFNKVHAYKGGTTPSCNHSYSENVVAPTCVAGGYTTYTCTSCGKSYTSDYTNAIGHNYGEWENVISATCTSDGTQQRRCSSCGDVQTQLVPELGHDYVGYTVDATCTQYGYIVYTCEKCGDSYESASGYSEWSTTCPDGVDPSRIESRTEYRYSDYDTFTSTTPNLGYDLVGSAWVTSGTGTNYYVPSWPGGFLTSHQVYVSYGGDPIVNWETATNKVTVDSTTTAGYIYWHWCRGDYAHGPIDRKINDTKTSEFDTFHAFFSTKAYNSQDDNWYYYPNGECCKDTYWYFPLEVKVQSYTTYEKQYTYGQWSAWSNWSVEACQESGTRQVETRTVYRYALGELADHNYRTEVVVSTCTTQGYTTYTCEECGYSYVGNYQDLAAHDTYWSTIQEVAPTCATEGFKVEVECCRTCGAEVGRETIMLAGPGHSWNEEKTMPSCTGQGYTTYTCEVCGESYMDDFVVAVGHSEEILPSKAPTCVEYGLTEGKKCSVCGDILLAQEEVPGLGHGYNAVVTAPSCTAQGYTEYVCYHCGDSYVSDEVAPLGHSYESVVTEPTYTEQGYTTHTCTRCGDSYVDNYTAPLVPETDVKVIISSVTGKAGDTVEVILTLENAPELRSLAISDLVYDRENLTLVSGQWLKDGAMMSPWNNGKEEGALLFEANEDLNGEIFKLTFAIKEDATAGAYSVSCVLTAKQREESGRDMDVAVAVMAGQIEVVEYITGDVDGSEFVSTDDAIYLLYHIMFGEDYAVNQDCDFDGSGFVSTDDAIYLLYHIMFGEEDYPLH